jgi:hypothetical protein
MFICLAKTVNNKELQTQHFVISDKNFLENISGSKKVLNPVISK